MVWIHGGGFVTGAGSQPIFDGTSLAKRGVVIVTLNYRLGALGFLTTPELSAESPRHVSGNYGLLDQIAALRWVQSNISAFGGNPENVTVFGQSAGAYSIAILTVSPLAKGLFTRAIMQSVPLMFQPTTRVGAKQGGTPRPSTSDISTRTATDLRAMSAPDVIKQLAPAATLSTGRHYYPVVDGWVLPDDPARLVGTSRQAGVPVLIGYTADEGNFFLPAAPKTMAEARAFIEAKFGTAAVERVMSTYPLTSDADAPATLTRIFGDYELLTSTVLTAKAMARRGAVYLFQFSRVSPQSRQAWNGAAHTAEIPYVFGTLPFPQLEPQDQAVSEAMIGAWISFAKTGNPNSAGLPGWPRYSPPGFEHLDYGDTIEVRSGFRRTQVEFWERLLSEQRGAK